MARHPNPNNKYTTISIKKFDKDRLRRIAHAVKETKNGTVYEKDADIFTRILVEFLDNHPQYMGLIAKPTYPASALDNNPNKSQRDYSPLVPT